jgi:hypothetical protein
LTVWSSVQVSKNTSDACAYQDIGCYPEESGCGIEECSPTSTYANKVLNNTVKRSEPLIASILALQFAKRMLSKNQSENWHCHNEKCGQENGPQANDCGLCGAARARGLTRQPSMEMRLERKKSVVNTIFVGSTAALQRMATAVKNQHTELMEFVDSGNIGEVIWIIEDQPELLNAQADDGFTALMSAVYIENIDIVNALIEAGAELDIPDKEGETALSMAIEMNFDEIEEALRAAGANG